MAKNESIALLLERLRADLGPAAFDVVDHWQDDPFAVGLARPDDHRYLVYVSTLQEEVFAFECENPSSHPDLPYDSNRMVELATYPALLAALRCHLHER